MVDPLDNLSSTEQLRRLLLEEEQDRIERLEARVGDDGRLKTSIVPIIADVLKEAGIEDHKRLASSVAPIVVQSIKTEIHNSRDMMVDALYPITGRLVAAAVRNAFKDLVDQLNKKLDSSLSVDRWRAKIKSKLTGRSEAEILLSEGAAFEIIELLLINRQTGLLMARAGAGDGKEAGVDGHLLSSILTAIMAFVRDAMKDASEQDLRTLHVGDLRLHLQVSPGAILAIKTKGPPPAGFETALNEIFYGFLTRWGDRLSDPDKIESRDEAALNEDLETSFKSLLEDKEETFQRSSKKGTILLAGVALLAAGWIGWTVYDRWLGAHIEDRAKTVIAAQQDLLGYPIDIDYDRSDNVLSVSGLVPDQRSLEGLTDRLEKALPEVERSLSLGTLPDRHIDLSGMPTASDLETMRSGLGEDLEATRKGFEETLEAVRVQMSSLSDGIGRIEERLPSPAEIEQASFREWLNHQSLIFADRDSLDDSEHADNLLQDIATRLSNLPGHIGLRIVGYGDDLGDERISAEVSRDRAALVADRLKALDIASDRLQTVGRGSEKRVGNVDGPGSVNRRVEFELTYRSDNGGNESEGRLDNGPR